LSNYYENENPLNDRKKHINLYVNIESGFSYQQFSLALVEK